MSEDVVENVKELTKKISSLIRKEFGDKINTREAAIICTTFDLLKGGIRKSFKEQPAQSD